MAKTIIDSESRMAMPWQQGSGIKPQPGIDRSRLLPPGFSDIFTEVT
jgi:hypothetical protein